MKGLVVVTVYTPGFEPGTIVTIFSFLEQNPWFDGSIQILHNQEDIQEMRKVFKKLPVQFSKVDPDIVAAADEIAEIAPQYKPRVAQFYSLCLYQFEGCKKLLFLDSDLLFRGSIRDLLDSSVGFSACGDGYYYKGMGHNRSDYSMQDSKNTGQSIFGFNAGFMLFDADMLRLVGKDKVLSYLNTDYYTRVKTNHSDQLIFNMIMEGHVNFISAKYNFRIGIAKEIRDRDSVDLNDAVVIHYTAKKKPWRLMQSLRAARHNEQYLGTFTWWMEAWTRIINKNIRSSSV